MPDNRKRILTGAAIAAGAVGAFFGTRAIMNWRLRREVDTQQYVRFQSRANSAQETRGVGARGEGTRVRSSGSGPVGGTRYQPHTQPDREPIPATGAAALEDVSTFDIDTPSATGLENAATLPLPVTADDLSAPLAQYLLAFYDLVHQVRMRRWENKAEGGIVPGQRSLNATDRANIQETLDRLAQHAPEVSDGDFADNTLEQRMYNLMIKVRDALQNLAYTDDDLLRLDGEIRSHACQVLDEVLVAGQEVREARQVYECG